MFVFDAVSKLTEEVRRKHGLGSEVIHVERMDRQDLVVIWFEKNQIVVEVCSKFESKDRWYFFIVNHWQPACSFISRAHEQFDLKGKYQLWLDDTPGGDGIAFTRCAAHTTYLMPDPHFIRTEAYAEFKQFCDLNFVPWPQRQPKVFWRGASTGYRSKLRPSWRDLPRSRLCFLAAKPTLAKYYDVGISKIVQLGEDSDINDLTQSGIIKDEVDNSTYLRYKYAIDIDGNANTWPGLFTKMIMGNTILKVTSEGGYSQWYYDLIKPWQHFVPIASDLSDLDDMVTWCHTNEKISHEISSNARELALSLTLPEALSLFNRELLAH